MTVQDMSPNVSGAYLLVKSRVFVAYDKNGVKVVCPMSKAKSLVREWRQVEPVEVGRYDGPHWTPQRTRIVTGCNGSGTGKIIEVKNDRI